MKGFKFISIFFAILLVQSQVSAKAIDDSGEFLEWALNEVKADGSTTAAEKLLIFTVENVTMKPKEYMEKAINATESLLQDKTLMENNKPEVLEFKKNLTQLMKMYEGELSLRDSLDSFANLTEYYYQMPEEKVTEETKFIIDILDKYDCKNVAMKMDTYLETFLAEFIKRFEENRNDLEKPILDWYDKFTAINDVLKKMESIIEFLELA